jgi:DNA replication protein DnaC
MSKGSSLTTLNTSDDGKGRAAGRPTPPSPIGQAGLGRPDCPLCHGIGYLREDLPPDHPRFGRAVPCTCLQERLQTRLSERLHRLSRLQQLGHLAFETFNPRGRLNNGPEQQESLHRAFNQAKNFADRREGWLLLQGGFGCGKTHLAAAIANATVALGIPTLYLTVPDLLDWLRASYDDEQVDFEGRFGEIRDVALLVMDDFGTQSATPWAQEKLFQILNYRYINRLPTVVTTNLALEEIEGRLRSRLSDPELVTIVRINAPDFRRPMEESAALGISSLDHHRRQTFGTFSIREDENLSADDRRNLQGAFEVAQRFAENPVGWLVLLGGYGCGKTHLAAAIANFRNSEGFPPLFVVVPDLLDHLRGTFSPSSPLRYDQRFEEVRSARLLVFDDLGTQNMTPWVREKLYQIFNHRYNAELPTVITTSSTLEEIDPRLRARMLDSRLCTVFAITAPAYLGGSKTAHRSSPRNPPGRKDSTRTG